MNEGEDYSRVHGSLDGNQGKLKEDDGCSRYEANLKQDWLNHNIIKPFFRKSVGHGQV